MDWTADRIMAATTTGSGIWSEVADCAGTYTWSAGADSADAASAARYTPRNMTEFVDELRRAFSFAIEQRIHDDENDEKDEERACAFEEVFSCQHI